MRKHTTHFDDCGCLTEKYRAEVGRLRAALKNIADREHEEPLPEGGCTCYFGDNGYTCGQPIAESALSDGKGE